VVSVHPGFTDTLDKLAKRTAASNPFIAHGGCRAYAARAGARLDKRIAVEKKEQKKR
jgi:metallo-beta-lactamase class B